MTNFLALILNKYTFPLIRNLIREHQLTHTLSTADIKFFLLPNLDILLVLI